MQLEMDMPHSQTPPSVQPPFNSPPQTVGLEADIFQGGTVGRSEAELLPSKRLPRFFPSPIPPQGKKKKNFFGKPFLLYSTN